VVSKRVLVWAASLVLVLGLGGSAWVQEPASQEYEPGKRGGPARAEAIAVGYLRTLWAAQQDYRKKNQRYARTLRELVGRGSFTRRMAQSDRGDYTVQLRSDGERYSAELVPKQYDGDHPAFYMDQSGVVRSQEGRRATAESPQLRKASR
jgi:hypothetical protein